MAPKAQKLITISEGITITGSVGVNSIRLLSNKRNISMFSCAITQHTLRRRKEHSDFYIPLKIEYYIELQFDITVSIKIQDYSCPFCIFQKKNRLTLTFLFV
ncbi:unnamed protein product [Nezara viridula]|uniref:Uncharacterized protein n=1 Tax=Nezara viridula TaxID=85310 RepID=A0A9P0MW78_NEZVI|nr:unnamed protein product [Nezara viridula]